MVGRGRHTWRRRGRGMRGHSSTRGKRNRRTEERLIQLPHARDWKEEISPFSWPCVAKRMQVFWCRFRIGTSGPQFGKTHLCKKDRSTGKKPYLYTFFRFFSASGLVFEWYLLFLSPFFLDFSYFEKLKKCLTPPTHVACTLRLTPDASIEEGYIHRSLVPPSMGHTHFHKKGKDNETVDAQ